MLWLELLLCLAGVKMLHMYVVWHRVQVAAAHPVAMDEEDDGGTDEVAA